VTYRVQSETAAIEARAQAIAIEQSVELPLEAIDDPRILDEIVGQVAAIEQRGPGLFDVQIVLSAETMPPEPGQLMNMLFGNTSLLSDVTLQDVDVPAAYLRELGGPTVGLAGLRHRLGVPARGLTATALKPQGLAAVELARIAHAAALGGIDIIKDDHGLADQAYSPFNARVTACAAAIARANRSTGRVSAYAPSLSGSLDQLREQIRIVRDAGLQMALIAPMVVGLPAFHTIAREAADIAFLAHPSLGGASGIAPPLLLGKIFRMLGADATIFPNYGGRFSYSAQTCLDIAAAARTPWGALNVCTPAPAGGMSLERVSEMLDVYGRDTILLIGGSLLSHRAGITAAAEAFATKVARHGQ
jgi:ribulose-bisphosphate carboxylase large chain